MKKKGRITGLFIVWYIFCAAVIGLGIYTILHTNFAHNGYGKAEGKIVDYISQVDEQGNYTYCPVYEYTVDGRVYHMNHNIYGSDKSRLGKSDTIYYDPDNPQQAHTDRSIAAGIIMLVIGTAFALVATGIFLKKGSEIFIGAGFVTIGVGLIAVVQPGFSVTLLVLLIFAGLGILTICRKIYNMVVLKKKDELLDNHVIGMIVEIVVGAAFIVVGILQALDGVVAFALFGLPLAGVGIFVLYIGIKQFVGVSKTKKSEQDMQ